MFGHSLILLSFLFLSLSRVPASPVRQANAPFRVRIASRSTGFSRTAGAQTQDNIPTFDPDPAYREYNGVPFKYARATQFLRGINLNTDTHPEAGYPQFDPNDVPGTLRFQIPDHSAAMQAPANPGSPSGASSPPDYIGGVPPVGPKTTKMPLVDFISGFMDVLYHGALQVGTPAQNLTFQADTGSADLWTPYNCRYCANQDYNARRSSTFKLTPARCHLTYGIGSARGVVAQDTVAMGGLTVHNQTMCAVQQVSDDFNEQPTNGIVGLAFGTIAVTKQPTFFENLLSQRKLVDSIFSMHLTRQDPDGSELCFGCYDSTKATGSISWHPVVSRTFWVLAMDGMQINGEKIPTNVTAAIDSGSSLSYFPQGVVDDLYAKIPGSRPAVEYGDAAFYEIPCNATATVDLSFGGQAYAFDRADLVLGKAASDTTMCISSIVAISPDLGDDFAIVGDNFMKSWYTVFDYSGRVGFAPSINNAEGQ